MTTIESVANAKIIDETVTDKIIIDTPVIDYEGSGYRTDFWEGQGREYEDAVERLTLSRTVPPQGKRIAEIGAGFGRLADMYLGYDQIILFDYSRTLLQEAVQRWGHDDRFVFVAGNIYQLPLATGLLDTLVMVRVMHHLADVPSALSQIERVLHRRSVAVLEYANKRNLKSMARWLLKKQSWSPLDISPIEFVELNFNFHPRWMQTQFEQSGLICKQQLAVSHLRLPLLKRLFSAESLARFDSRFFMLGGHFPWSPSIFVQANNPEGVVPPETNTAVDIPAALFRCPHCFSEAFVQVSANRIQCTQCQQSYAQQAKIWDFKSPI